MKPFSPCTLTLAAVALTLTACAGRAGADSISSADPAVGTPLPTVAPVVPAIENDPAQESPVLLTTIRGDVQPEAQSIFGLTGEAGDAVRIEVRARIGDPDIVLELGTPGGGLLARVDVGGPGEPEVIGEFRFPASGYYELGVRSLEGAGQIDVLVYGLGGQTLSGGGVIPAFGQPVTGTMDRPATIHTFKLQVERGQRFDLRATALSGDLDLLFELYDPQGQAVASRDDDLDYDPYLFNFMPGVGGEYTLVLTNYEQTTGSYEVLVERSQSSGQLSTGRSQHVSLPTEPHHGVWLSFVGNAGEGLIVEATPISPQVDLTLAIYDVFGNRLSDANLGGPGVAERLGGVQLPYDGPYQLEFGTLREGGEVRYDVIPRTVADFETKGPLVTFPTTRTVAVSGSQTGAAHVYWFEGEMDQRVTLDAKTMAGTIDLSFDLLDQSGNVISAHDDDRGRDPVLENFSLPYTGRYYVLLRLGGAHRGGEYRFRAETPAPPDQPSDG